MKTGTIISQEDEVSSYPFAGGRVFKRTYYELCEGEFTLIGRGRDFKFNGQHFVCKGSEHWKNTSGDIYGLELLDEEYKVIDKLPDSLIL